MPYRRRRMIAIARVAVGTAVRAAPGLTLLYVLVMLAEAVAPIAVAWLTKWSSTPWWGWSDHFW
ncbi:hypothetical protein [Nonomuraea insulae]|uniref:ABC transmembrane type-1 domain-containing protein n=1 Tax=Nonomuraea insulae TaxID=1616787 RepID=A0ABW1CKV9_9ACTN